MDPIIVTACVLCVVGPALALAVRSGLEKRRTAAMRQFAVGNQLEFRSQADDLDGLGLSQLPIIRSGLDAKYLNVGGRRQQDGEELVFDYQHRVGTLLTALTEDSLMADAVLGVRKNRAPSYYNMTFVARRCAGAQLAPFVVRSGRVVQGHLPPAALRALSGLPAHVHAEGAGEWLAVYRFDRRQPVEELNVLRRVTERLTRDLLGLTKVPGAAIPHASQSAPMQRRIAL